MPTNSPTTTEQVIERVFDDLRAEPGISESDRLLLDTAEAELCAAIASLPPKPVDGEVAERAIDHARKYKTPTESDPRREFTLAQMEIALSVALSRNTEPMVTDAMLVAGARAAADRHIECGSYGNIEAIYLAMLSAGKKGTDDD